MPTEAFSLITEGFCWHIILSIFIVLELVLFLQILLNKVLPFKLNCHFIP